MLNDMNLKNQTYLLNSRSGKWFEDALGSEKRQNLALELWNIAFGRELWNMEYKNTALERAIKKVVALGDASQSKG